MKKTTIDFELEEETLIELKKFARDSNKTVDEVVEDAIREGLKKADEKRLEGKND